VLAADEVIQRLALEGGEPIPGAPEAYAADIDREEMKWSKLVTCDRPQRGMKDDEDVRDDSCGGPLIALFAAVLPGARAGLPQSSHHSDRPPTAAGGGNDLMGAPPPPRR